MSDRWLFVLTFLSALGCGLVAGVFFAFSTCVIKAVARIQPSQGRAAMQSINVVAMTPAFMVALFGTAAACALLAVSSLLIWPAAGSIYRLAGALCYLVGAVVVTIAFNVPKNNALAAVDPEGLDGTRLWADYVASWTAWNHVRTVASVVAAAALMMALGS